MEICSLPHLDLASIRAAFKGMVQKGGPSAHTELSGSVVLDGCSLWAVLMVVKELLYNAIKECFMSYSTDCTGFLKIRDC